MRWLAAAPACLAACLLAGVSACSVPGGTSAAETRANDAQTLQPARAQFAAAADAVRSGDRAAFLAQTSVEGASPSATVRRDLERIYDTLSRLPWRSFSFTVAPLSGSRGAYRVVGSGQLGATGPPDRLAVVRYLTLRRAARGVAIAADRTPENLRRRYLMALHDPVVLRRSGFIVLADQWARDRASAVVTSAARARSRLATLGLDTSPTVLVTVYGSAENIRDALAVKAVTARLAFFSHPPLRIAKKAWPVYDVAVMGPWLRDPSISLEDTLTHELAHAYTVRWFTDDPKPPALLVEGIAEAAEGVPFSQELRDEVATGGQLWPLPESFGVTDVWDGADMRGVGLGYEVGGSIVGYVVSQWGADHLESFVTAVAAAQPTEAGMDAALERSLDVGWARFLSGWRGFVLHGG